MNTLSADPNTKLDTLQSTVIYLQDLVEQLLAQRSGIKEWITEREAIRVSGLSRGTLLKLRKEGKISSSTLSGKQNFYKVSDFKRLLEINEQNR